MTEPDRVPFIQRSRRALLASAAGMLGAALPLTQSDSARGAPAATTLHVLRPGAATLNASGPEI